MGAPEHTWYRPGDPGAPQPGDLVVAWSGVRARLVDVHTYTSPRRWVLDAPEWPWTNAIRRTTEAELAAWALDQPGGAP